jgi:hypothetical protein
MACLSKTVECSRSAAETNGRTAVTARRFVEFMQSSFDTSHISLCLTKIRNLR